MLLSKADITKYNEDGVIVLRGVFDDWISDLKSGADYNINNPSSRALVHKREDDSGALFEDFSNWKEIRQYADFVNNSNLGRISAELMNSNSVQFFHDHYLHKYPGSMVDTPWHQDIPYYFVDGDQTVSLWIPLAKRSKESSLRCALGSHKLAKYVRPTSWSTNQSFYKDSSLFMDLPDMDDGNFEIMQWSMDPGDAIAFNYKLIHSAGANTTNRETQTLSMRVIGDDVRYTERPGKTSPHYENLNQKNGDKLREDWFPYIYKS